MQKQNETRTLQHHHESEREKSNGIEQQKRDGILGLFDVQNWDGHNYITPDTVDECKNLLNKYPSVDTYYGVKKLLSERN